MNEYPGEDTISEDELEVEGNLFITSSLHFVRVYIVSTSRGKGARLAKKKRELKSGITLFHSLSSSQQLKSPPGSMQVQPVVIGPLPLNLL